MKRALLPLVCLILASPGVRADVWEDAIDKTTKPALDEYEALLARGDEAALSASSRSTSLATITKELDVAVEAYRAAAKKRPKAAEPYFRIATLYHAFYFQCTDLQHSMPPTCHDAARRDARAQDTVEAWDAFEARAPLDPRVNELLLERAILRTKMIVATPKNTKLLEGALRDYKAILDRADGLMEGRVRLALGNLAETYMMLGRIDEAIDTYKESMRTAASTSTLYGLAVALDRDERGAQAMTIIRDQGLQDYELFQRMYEIGEVFYVPAGEEQYYFGLIEEAFGNTDASIDHWKQFLKSGAHPQFQPRAKAHLDGLLAKKNLRWRPLPPPDPFREIP